MKEEQEIINSIEALSSEVYQLKILISNLTSPGAKNWMNLKELCLYLPDHPSKNTVYAWVGQSKIPYHKPKGSKKLRFLRDEIDAWLLSGEMQPTKPDPIELLSLFKKPNPKNK